MYKHPRILLHENISLPNNVSLRHPIPTAPFNQLYNIHNKWKKAVKVVSQVFIVLD